MTSEKDKPLKVSDWSQKYKLIIYGISGIGAGIGLYLIIQRLDKIIELLSK